MTCRQIDGLCDVEIPGDTPEEVLDNRLRHLTEAGVMDPSHRKILEDLGLMSDTEIARWTEKFMKLWEYIHS